MTGSEWNWVGVATALRAHSRSLGQFGGPGGVRDHGLLASALERARHRWAYSSPRPSLAALAASYAFGLARNHPFVDGNKRTAFLVCLLFLGRNGFSLEASQTEKCDAFVRLAEGSPSEEELALWLAPRLIPRQK